MGLFDRLSTLIRSNINDLISSAEHPEKMIKQVILDMQNQLMQVKTQVAIAIADQLRRGRACSLGISSVSSVATSTGRAPSFERSSKTASRSS